MDETQYNELLEIAYKELPQFLYKKERFEIPQVRGRLIKSRTVVNNFKEISSDFSRSLEHLSKFMLKDLGVRGEIDSRKNLVLHSRFSPTALNKAVEKYYKSYIECPHCNSPDTEFSNNETNLECKACGHLEKIPKL